MEGIDGAHKDETGRIVLTSIVIRDTSKNTQSSDQDLVILAVFVTTRSYQAHYVLLIWSVLDSSEDQVFGAPLR